MARYQKGSLLLIGNTYYGRFREDVELPDGRIKRVYRKVRLGSIEEFPTKRLARRALDERLEAINDLGYRPQSRLTVRQFAQMWSDEVLAQRDKKATRVSMAASIRNHIIPFFGDRQMDDITAHTVQQFVNHLKAKGLMPRSVKFHFMTLRSIWRTAMLWGKVKHDPFPKKGVVLPKMKATDRQPFSEEETRQIINAANEPDKTLYWIMAETGLRAGEALALRVRDINFSAGVLQVERSWVCNEMGTPKSEAGSRNPVLSPELLAHLHQRYALANPTDYLVPGAKPGRPLTYAAFLDRLHKVLAELGIDRRGFHGFRYTNATESVAEGADVKVLQKRLGHASVTTTLQFYARATSAAERALAAKLGAKFAPKLHPTGVA